MVSTKGVDLKSAFAQAALLRNRLESCLRAAGGPMQARECLAIAGVAEISKDYAKVAAQLGNMVKQGIAVRIGAGNQTAYAINKNYVPPKAKGSLVGDADLRLKVNRADKTISFQFQGMNITIEITG